MTCAMCKQLETELGAARVRNRGLVAQLNEADAKADSLERDVERLEGSDVRVRSLLRQEREGVERQRVLIRDLEEDNRALRARLGKVEEVGGRMALAIAGKPGPFGTRSGEAALAAAQEWLSMPAEPPPAPEKPAAEGGEKVCGRRWGISCERAAAKGTPFTAHVCPLPDGHDEPHACVGCHSTFDAVAMTVTPDHDPPRTADRIGNASRRIR